MGGREEEQFLPVLTIQRTFCSWSWAALDKLEIFFLVWVSGIFFLYSGIHVEQTDTFGNYKKMHSSLQ